MPDAGQTTGRAWTVLVYVAADNNLEPAALNNIAQMSAVPSSPSAEILIEIDRVPGYTSDPLVDVPDFTDAKRFRVENNHLVELEDLGEINTADPSSLATFIMWGLAQAPADHVALFLWDHGGAQLGFGQDATSGGQVMSIGGVGQALATGLGGRRIDILGFDACLMGQVEIAHQLAPFARWYVASEESEPAPGWQWTAVIGAAVSAGASEDFATSIPSSFVTGIAATDPQEASSVTLSVIDLDKIDAVWTALQDLGAALLQQVADGHGAAAAQALLQVPPFGLEPQAAPTGYTSDASELADSLSAELPSLAAKASTLKATIAAAVVANETGAKWAAAKGLSVYAELTSVMDPQYAALGGVMGSPWYNAIKAIRSALASQNAPPALSGFQLTNIPGATNISALVSSSIGLAKVEWFVASYLSSTSEYLLFTLPASIGPEGKLAESWNYTGFFPSDGTNLSLASVIFAGSYQAAGQPYNMYMIPARYTPPGGAQATGALAVVASAAGVQVGSFYTNEAGVVAALPLATGGSLHFGVGVIDTQSGATTWIYLDQALTVPQSGLVLTSSPVIAGTYELGFIARDVAGNVAGVSGMVVVGTHVLQSGYVSLTWSLQDSSGTPVGCAPGDYVGVTSRPVGAGTEFVDNFDCSAGGGTTSVITGGTFDVTVQLFDVNNAAVTQASQPIRITIDGDTVDIGHFVLVVP
jgi:hypothetical protein